MQHRLNIPRLFIVTFGGKSDLIIYKKKLLYIRTDRLKKDLVHVSDVSLPQQTGVK